METAPSKEINNDFKYGQVTLVSHKLPAINANAVVQCQKTKHLEITHNNRRHYFYVLSNINLPVFRLNGSYFTIICDKHFTAYQGVF